MNDRGLALVVEDEPDICWALERILRGQSYSVLVAGSGAQAQALSAQHVFRLALLDAKLPDMDGLELIQQFHCNQPMLPIVLISGFYYEDDPQIQESIRTGLIVSFVGKPFLHSLLRTALEKAMGISVT